MIDIHILISQYLFIYDVNKFILINNWYNWYI